MSVKQRKAFENFTMNYSELHKELVRFVQDLPSKFKKNVPADLQNVRVLPTIMAPSDSDFSVDDAVTVLEKWEYISVTLQSILQKMVLYVVDNGWYKDQKMKLEWWIQLVKNSAVFLGMETPNYGKVVEVSSGIGGVNWYSDDMVKRMDMKTKEQSIRSLNSALNAVRT